MLVSSRPLCNWALRQQFKSERKAFSGLQDMWLCLSFRTNPVGPGIRILLDQFKCAVMDWNDVLGLQ